MLRFFLHESTGDNILDSVVSIDSELAVRGQQAKFSRNTCWRFPCPDVARPGGPLRRRHVEDELVSVSPINTELGAASPHIADYWQVVAHRLWLVVLIFGVTTASAI